MLYIYGTPCTSDTKTGKYVFASKFIMLFKKEMGVHGGYIYIYIDSCIFIVCFFPRFFSALDSSARPFCLMALSDLGT